MPEVEKELKKVLKDFKPRGREIKELQSFQKASERFEEWVKSGYASRRGNHLISIEDAHLKQDSINQG